VEEAEDEEAVGGVKSNETTDRDEDVDGGLLFVLELLLVRGGGG